MQRFSHVLILSHSLLPQIAERMTFNTLLNRQFYKVSRVNQRRANTCAFAHTEAGRDGEKVSTYAVSLAAL